MDDALWENVDDGSNNPYAWTEYEVLDDNRFFLDCICDASSLMRCTDVKHNHSPWQTSEAAQENNGDYYSNNPGWNGYYNNDNSEVDSLEVWIWNEHVTLTIYKSLFQLDRLYTS